MTLADGKGWIEWTQHGEGYWGYLDGKWRPRTVYHWSNRWQVWMYVGVSHTAKRRTT